MPEYGWLTLYSVAILLFSLLGGSLPFLGRVTHSRLQFYLSASAGVMLGAAFFHVMPDAMEMCGPNFGWWMSLGVIGLFCIERFIAPHSHELDGGHHHHHDHEHEHHHTHDHPDGADHRAAAPAVAGWMAVVGLTIHTFINGLGLAGAVQTDLQHAGGHAGSWILRLSPGIAMFLAIVLHKPADALAISTVLSKRGTNRRKIGLVQLGFALMVPVGILAFIVTQGAIRDRMDNSEDFVRELTGAALAVSAGTFLFIALSDLLPEVQFHRHDRIQLSLTLFAGVILMGGIAYLEGHDHEEHGHEHAARVQAANPARPGGPALYSDAEGKR